MSISDGPTMFSPKQVESLLRDATINSQAKNILRDIELAIHSEARSLKESTTDEKVSIKSIVAAVKRNYPDLAGYVGPETIRSMISVSPNRLSDNERAIENLAFKIRSGTHETDKEEVLAVKTWPSISSDIY